MSYPILKTLSIVACKRLQLLGSTNAVVSLSLLRCTTLAVGLIVEVAKTTARLVAVGDVNRVAVLVVIAVILPTIQRGRPCYINVANIAFALITIVVDLHLLFGGNNGCREHCEKGGCGEVHFDLNWTRRVSQL